MRTGTALKALQILISLPFDHIEGLPGTRILAQRPADMFGRQSHPFHAYHTLELQSEAKQVLERLRENQTLRPRRETSYLELSWSSSWIYQLVLQ